MSRTYRKDDHDSYETRKLTREIDKLNREVGCIRIKSFENAPDFAQSTIYQTTRPRQSDSGIATVRTPNPDFGTGSNILQNTNIGIGAKSEVASQSVINDKHIPASKKIAPEDNFCTYREGKSIQKNKSIIKPATFDGQGSWIDYKSHACSSINGWTEVEKGLYLAVSLRGQAQGVLGNQPTDNRHNF
ncbi:unnamed protein product [Mytilus coruscus]|uniref:Uncharacterized protein n=1 Tax=Mytilus coruscus TaxID=42192 RepID=A0A6J8D5Y3_MYTCO|nr:unnamed protein product [Mytilus coruscus]